MDNVVVTSGYFDPLHVGHLELFEMARSLGSKLVVIVNNDIQAVLKKGSEFMPASERMRLIAALKPVDEVFLSIDMDRTVCRSLEKAFREYGATIFAKGGDRFAGEIPESVVCRNLGIKIVDGLGAKVQSSSALIDKAKA